MTAPEVPPADPPTAEGLASAARAAARRGPPPVELWDPPFCGDLDMRIARDGTWFYNGTPIGREPLVKLFASILKREGDAYFLVTPVEKVGITVDDAPFVAANFTSQGAGSSTTLVFTTSLGDTAAAGPEHPIRMTRDALTGEPAPYVRIRRNLEALIDRKSFYRLVDLGCVETFGGERQFGVWSGGRFFALMPEAELEGG